MKKIIPVVIGLMFVMGSFSVASADTDVGVQTSYDEGTGHYLPMQYANQLRRVEDVSKVSPFDQISLKTTTSPNPDMQRSASKTVDTKISKDSGTDCTFAQDGVDKGLNSYWWDMDKSENKGEKPYVVIKNLALYHPSEGKWSLYDLKVTAKPSAAGTTVKRNVHIIGIGYTQAFPRLQSYGYNGVKFHYEFTKADAYSSLPASVKSQLTTTSVKTNLTYQDIDCGQRISFSDIKPPKVYKWSTRAASDDLSLAISEKSLLCCKKNSDGWYYFEQKGTPDSISKTTVKTAGGVAINSSDFYIFIRSNREKGKAFNTDGEKNRKGSYTGIAASGKSMFEKEPNSPYETVDGLLESEKPYKDAVKTGFKFSTNQVISTGYPDNSGISAMYAVTKYPAVTTEYNSGGTKLSGNSIETTLNINKQDQQVPTISKIKYYDELKKKSGLDEIITADDWKHALETDGKVTVNNKTKCASFSEYASMSVSTELHKSWQKGHESRYNTNTVIARIYLPWVDIDLDVLSYRAIAGQNVNAVGKITVNKEIKIKNVTFWLDSKTEPENADKEVIDGEECIHESTADVTTSKDTSYSLKEFKTLEGSNPGNPVPKDILKNGSTKGEHTLYMKVRFDIPSSASNDTTEVTVHKPLVVTDDERAATLEAEDVFIIGSSVKARGTLDIPKEQKVTSVGFYLDYDTIEKDGDKEKVVPQSKPLANSEIEGIKENPVMVNIKNIKPVTSELGEDYRHYEFTCDIPTDVMTDEGTHRVHMDVLYAGEKEPDTYTDDTRAEKDNGEAKNEIIRYVNKDTVNTLKSKVFQEKNSAFSEGINTTVDSVVDNILSNLSKIVKNENKDEKEEN